MDSDIVISGGGIAGLTAAAAFGSAGFRVICTDPAPPPSLPPSLPIVNAAHKGTDLRSTALLARARPVLEQAGLWERLTPYASALRIMRIVDASGLEPGAKTSPKSADFTAQDIAQESLGWNFPNWILRREILARLGELANVTFRPGIALTALTTRESAAHVRFSDGRSVWTRLVIGADGRDSFVRQSLGIKVKTRHYGQKAIVFSVAHPKPHAQTSTEIHQSGGPFTLVPLPKQGDDECSAVVWMDTAANIARLSGLSPTAFEAEATARSCGVLGPLRLVSERSVWPIISQCALHMSAERTALIAEAAHVLPPIGAQGLNMSLADIHVLLELARTAGQENLGDAAMLHRYHARRHPEVAGRMAGIDLLNKFSMTPLPGLHSIRGQALSLLGRVSPLKHAVMQAGLGARRS